MSRGLSHAPSHLLTCNMKQEDSKLPAASSPPSKRHKNNEGAALVEGMSWRDTSIIQFGLLALPDGWKDSVARGTENAGKDTMNIV